MAAISAKQRLLNVLHKEAERAERPPVICPGGMMNAAIVEIMEKTGHRLPEAHEDAHLMAELAADIHREVRSVGVNLKVPEFTCAVEVRAERIHALWISGIPTSHEIGREHVVVDLHRVTDDPDRRTAGDDVPMTAAQRRGKRRRVTEAAKPPLVHMIHLEPVMKRACHAHPSSNYLYKSNYMLTWDAEDRNTHRQEHRHLSCERVNTAQITQCSGPADGALVPGR